MSVPAVSASATMRTIVVGVLLGCVVMLAPSEASAQRGGKAGGDFGLGLILGDPTGVTGKHVLSASNAIDWAVGFGTINGRHLHVHADYLWEWELYRWPSAAMNLHAGVGPKLGFRDRRNNDDVFLLGARGPVGLNWRFTKAPFDVFIEIAAGLWIVENVDFDLDAAIGGRYWF